MWVKCGMVGKAGEEALKAKDMNALELLRGKASGPQLAEIERMINQLKPKR
jgi:vacuolar protein sorting-associated protein 16